MFNVIRRLFQPKAKPGVSWACRICGQAHGDVPTCFGIDAPWRAFVPAEEFEQRVELTESLCVVDEEHFFIRGHIEIPIHAHSEPLAFSVWSSLSEKSFRHVVDRWEDAGRASDPPYFGWLSSPIHVYPNVIHLPLSVQSQAPDVVPLFKVMADDHPLAIDQRNGISMTRWHKMALELLR